MNQSYIYQIYDLMKTISNKLVFIYFVCLKQKRNSNKLYIIVLPSSGKGLNFFAHSIYHTMIHMRNMNSHRVLENHIAIYRWFSSLIHPHSIILHSGQTHNIGSYFQHILQYYKKKFLKIKICSFFMPFSILNI